MKHQEFDLQKSVCLYLDMQFPHSLYMSDTVASLKLTMGQAVRNKAIQKSGFKTPDLIVFHPKGQYHGLFIELKTSDPFNKKGNPKTPHIAAQKETIDQLKALGYYATFASSFDNAKTIIDNYMKL